MRTELSVWKRGWIQQKKNEAHASLCEVQTKFERWRTAGSSLNFVNLIHLAPLFRGSKKTGITFTPGCLTLAFQLWSTTVKCNFNDLTAGLIFCRKVHISILTFILRQSLWQLNYLSLSFALSVKLSFVWRCDFTKSPLKWGAWEIRYLDRFLIVSQNERGLDTEAFTLTLCSLMCWGN